ncbi:MAG: 50S ribosomal protein L10 [Tissierellia bacterium]|nr:50S ribosomal protein L10 [Tissierellia bacterium]
MREETLKAKQSLVEEIKSKIENSQALVLVDYRGLNVEQLNDLRSLYRKAGVDYKVYKNTMMTFAFKELGLDGMEEFLAGPSAVAFSNEDPISAAKITEEFAKKNEALEIKAGVVEGKIIDVAGVKALATLPSKEELLAKALGSMNAPIQGFVNVLNGTMKGLVVALNAIAEQKEASA